MVKQGLKVTVNTDNETVFATTVKAELARLAQADSITRTDLAAVVLEGFRSRMGSRELPNRGELRNTLFASLLPSGLPADAKEQLATDLAQRFHVRHEPGKPEQTVQRVLDVVLGIGG